LFSLLCEFYCFYAVCVSGLGLFPQTLLWVEQVGVAFTPPFNGCRNGHG
jgi:hypothetical protein